MAKTIRKPAAARAKTNSPGKPEGTTQQPEVREATFLYGTFDAMQFPGSDKPVNAMTAIEKMEIARDGLSKRDLEHLKEQTSLGYETLSKVLMVTKATLINKKGDDKFNPALSERILSIADLYSYGYEVFEDDGRFNSWMSRPNAALGGKAPFELIDNQFGREEVRNIIGRIEYGVYS